MKLNYVKPEVLEHAAIAFETAVSSCNPPSVPVNAPGIGDICVNPDQTWEPYNP